MLPAVETLLKFYISGNLPHTLVSVLMAQELQTQLDQLVVWVAVVGPQRQEFQLQLILEATAIAHVEALLAVIQWQSALSLAD